MKVYMLNYFVFDLEHVYEEYTRLFKTYEGAKAAMEKVYREEYSEYVYNIEREEGYIRASDTQYQVCFTISEEELED